MNPRAPIGSDRFVNIDAEQDILGAIMLNNDAYRIVAPFLQPKHFYEGVHANIYECAAALINAGRKASPVTLKTFLDREPPVGELTVPQYLASMAANLSTSISVKEYARTIMELANIRALIGSLERTNQELMALRPDQHVADILADLEEDLMHIRSEIEEVGVKATIGQRYIQNVSQAYQQKAVQGVPVCLPEIARVISSPVFGEGTLVGLLSASGEGKTSLTMQVIAHAYENNHPVGFFSYDQSAEETARQLYAQKFGVEARRQIAGDVSSKEAESMIEFGEWLDQQPFQIFECSDQKAAHIASMARAFVRRYDGRANAKGEAFKTPLIVVDHIGEVTPEDRRGDEGTKAKEINKVFKACAKQTGSAWLVLNQRNSFGIRRENPRPISADLYGGQGAKAAYTSIFYLYRPEVYRDERLAIAASDRDRQRIDQIFPVSMDGKAEIGAIKVRFGSTKIRKKLLFEERFTRYVSEERERTAQGELLHEGMFG